MFATDIYNRSPRILRPDKMLTMVLVLVAFFWMVAVRWSGIAVGGDMAVVMIMRVFTQLDIYSGVTAKLSSVKQKDKTNLQL